jgi:hypothetical protein
MMILNPINMAPVFFPADLPYPDLYITTTMMISGCCLLIALVIICMGFSIVSAFKQTLSMMSGAIISWITMLVFLIYQYTSIGSNAVYSAVLTLCSLMIIMHTIQLFVTINKSRKSKDIQN